MNRQRQRNRLHELVVKTLERECTARGLRRSDLAAMLDRDPAQITRWLSGPSNWSIDTISDLLLCVGGELSPAFVPFERHREERTNDLHELAAGPTNIAATHPGMAAGKVTLKAPRRVRSTGVR